MPETSHDANDERWCELADADTKGEPLDERERAFLRRHATDSVAREAEAALLAEMAEIGRPDQNALTAAEDDALAEAVISQFRDEAGTRDEVLTLSGRVVVAGFVGSGLAAAAALAFMLRPAPAPTLPASAPILTAERPTEADTDERVLRSGSLLSDGGAVGLGAPVPAETWLSVGSDHTCIGASVCSDEGARLRLRAGAQLELERGKIRVDGHLAAFEIVTFQGKVASDGGRFTVEVSDEQVLVVVLVGPVTVSDHGGETSLSSGERRVLGRDGDADPSASEETESTDAEPGRPTPEPTPESAAEMLARAQSLRGAGQLRQAAAAYEKLSSSYPKSTEAHAAAVTSGKLQLDLGKPRRALHAFDRYLEGGGPLAEEAAYGRVRALDRLGRSSERDAAVDAFSRRYPDSVYVAEVEALRD